jgi:DNA-binding transcriptional ArsR family regulator
MPIATRAVPTPTAADALRHPLRVRILEALNEQDMSSVQFIDRVLNGDSKDPKLLSNVSHHFRVLAAGPDPCLVAVAHFQRRGAVETVYRGKARALFTMYQGLFARVEGAVLADTFDSRNDRHLVWIAMKLDEQGWDEFTDILDEAFADVERVRREATDRLAATDREPIPATFGMLGFESPAEISSRGAAKRPKTAGTP